MKKRMAAGALAVMCVAMIMVPAALATWTDDWLAQKVTQGPSYFEGQKRGYMQGGSFSARWPSHADSPVSVSPPTIKAGCGGIDMFTGGISFMDFEYLVQKLQRVLQSASGYAFQIGLKVLCEKCSSALEWVTGISDALNSMQIDDCKAGKAIVAYAAKDMPIDAKIKSELASSIADFKLSTGEESSWKRIQERVGSDGGKLDNYIGDVKNLIAGCPEDLQAVFLREGSMLDHVGGRLQYPQEHIALIRGLIGDIKITDNKGLPHAQYVPPCSENGWDPYDAMAAGNVYVRADVNGVCMLVSDAEGSIASKVQKMMMSISQKMSNSSALTSEEEEFIKANPLSIQLSLRAAMGTGTESQMIALLSDVTTKAYTYMSISDLYGRIYTMIDHMRTVRDAQGSGGPGGVSCDLRIVQDTFDKVSEFSERIQRLTLASAESYKKSAVEINSVITLSEKIRSFDALAMGELQKRFHAPMARRAIGR